MSSRTLISCLIACTVMMPAIAEDPGAQQVVAAFHAALASGDSDAALACLSPDVVIFEGGGAELSRDEYASHHLGGDMKFVQNTRREIVDQTSSSNEDLAWVITRSRTTGTYREKTIDLVGTETMVLRRTADAWHIVHIHWSSRAAKKSH